MFLNGALRQCKSLFGCQRYFSLKTLKQRWSAQCVKPISRREEREIANGYDVTPLGCSSARAAKSFVAQMQAPS
jgi:hypothetical protein